MATLSAPLEQKASPLSVLKQGNFRLLWIGEAISLLGDQFYLIALPWLVLQLTGDSFAVGAVLALAGIPRALFMLIGGALTDRFSPRSVMLISNLLRMAIVGLMTVTVLTNTVQLWMIYIFTLLFGLIDAFFFPAQSAIVPRLVDRANLQTGNAIIHGTAQLSLFLGPVLAGTLIALFTTDGTSLEGIGIALGIDTLTFLASAVSLWFMRVPAPISGETTSRDGVLQAIRSGISVIWNDVKLRAFFMVVAAMGLLVNGPLSVGIPVLANTRFTEGAVSFGLMMSALGGGALIGTILAAVLPRPSLNRTGTVLLSISMITGFSLILIGFVEQASVGAILAGLIGAANGYSSITFITWLQARTPDHMQGRVMSLMMFSSVGLVPISHAVSGALLSWSAIGTFFGAGAFLILVVIGAALHPATRALD